MVVGGRWVIVVGGGGGEGGFLTGKYFTGVSRVFGTIIVSRH